MCALLRPSERIAKFTASGVRLRLFAERARGCDWIFVPGGPGLGSEVLEELVHAVGVSGRSWLLDLPGDGSNVSPPGPPASPCSIWPDVLVEAAKAFPRSVMVGRDCVMSPWRAVRWRARDSRANQRRCALSLARTPRGSARGLSRTRHSPGFRSVKSNDSAR